MLYVATILEGLLKKHGIKPAEASRRTGIFPPQWSRWINGDQPVINDSDFEKMCAILFTDPIDQAHLQKARLQQYLHGPGSELVEIIVKPSHPGSALHEASVPYSTIQIPRKSRKDLDRIATKLTTDKDLRELVHRLANYSTGEE